MATVNNFESTPFVFGSSTVSDNSKGLNIPLTDSTKIHRKHRFTMLIGYGEEAGYVLKRCEQLKYRLGLVTNIQFLTYLIEYFEEHDTQHKTNISPDETSVNKNTSESFPSYIYDVKFKTFNTQKPENTNIIENKDSLISHHVISTSSNYNEEPKQQQLLHEQLQQSTIQINANVDQHQETQNKNNENIQLPTSLVNHNILYENNLFPHTNIHLSTKRKLSDNNDNPQNENESKTTGKFPLSLETEKEQCQMNESPIKPADITSCLTLSTLNIKALKIIHQYMENIKHDLHYYHGYISCSKKLKNFLDDYRFATSTSFTVRSSRSYIKKRALNAMKAVRGDNSETSVLQNISYIKFPESQNLSNSKEVNKIDIHRLELASHNGIQNDQDKDGADESMVTGPLRWEFILGKPPIPFTGVPFFIIGNTQYQCFYATADIRTQRRKEKIAQILKENPGVKTRIRRSMKRDCKAVMCIKSIVTFPHFSIVDKMHAVQSKKGCRKLKAATLENLRDAVEKGEAAGHPAFWVHIPLPNAHSTHDITNPSNRVTETETDNMDEIAHILELAAQYGGQLEIAQEGADNIVHLKINDSEEQMGNNQSLEISSDFLCINEQARRIIPS